MELGALQPRQILQLFQIFIGEIHLKARWPKVNELMIGAERTLNIDERKKLYAEGLKLIADQAYWVGVIH